MSAHNSGIGVPSNHSHKRLYKKMHKAKLRARVRREQRAAFLTAIGRSDAAMRRLAEGIVRANDAATVTVERFREICAAAWRAGL